MSEQPDLERFDYIDKTILIGPRVVIVRRTRELRWEVEGYDDIRSAFLERDCKFRTYCAYEATAIREARYWASGVDA